MPFRTIHAFQERINYTKIKNSSWRAEFHGPVDVLVEETTLERCRSRAPEQLDDKLAAWLAGGAEAGKSRRQGRAGRS